MTNTTSPAAGDGTSPATVDGIGKAAGKGLRWSLMGTVAMKVASFGMGLVLARLLSPADFGIYAIALSATQFVMHINDAGLIAAAVQWRGRFETMAPTATTLAFGFSLVVYCGFWVGAPTFATLAGSPSATTVVRLLTLTIIIDGVTAVRSAALMRNFQQDRLMTAIGVGFIANFFVSIALALAGCGPYAFAGGQLSGAAVTGVLVLVLARVPLRLGLDRAVAAKLLRFGLPLAASLGIEAVLMNADYVIVGRLLGVVPLGYYLLAFNTSSWAVSLLGTAVRYVSLPAFSRLSDQEMDSLSSGVRRAMTLLITAVAPVVVIMSVLAPELVAVLFGDRWLPAAPVLRYLMILTVVRLFTSLTLDALTGAGVTRVVLWVNLAWAVALVPALYAGTRLAGIVGTALAHAAAGLLVAVPFAVLALLRVGVRLGSLPRMLVRPVAAGLLAAAVAVVTRLLVGGSPLLGLCAAGGASMLCYAATAVPRAQLRDWLGRSQTSTDFGEASYDRPNRMDGSDARTIGDDQSAGRL